MIASGLLAVAALFAAAALGQPCAANASAQTKPAPPGAAPVTPPAAPAAAKGTASKPTIVLAADGFPAGNDTPEGAATDLARAFLQRNATLFLATCIPPFTGGDSKIQYQSFLDQTATSMKAEAARKTPSPHGPKAILKVFAARPLSHDGPASYAYATFGFKNLEFVDVKVKLWSGDTAINRTLVLQDPMGKWFVYPTPTASPLLSTGLNDETASAKDFSAAYVIGKAKPAAAK